MRRAHLIGIAGSGMRSLAELLDSAGWQVSGSDLATADLSDERFAIARCHRAESVHEQFDLVIHSDAISRDNPELVRARQLGLCTLTYPQALGHLTAGRVGLAVAGTHGKSTTAAMAAEILVAAGLDPTVVYGATPVGGGSGGRFGRGELTLAEACEYRENFLHLRPKLAVILGIEHDHFDFYRSQEQLERAFARFARQVPPDGLVLYRHGCTATWRATRDLRCASQSFGLAAGADWRAVELASRRGVHRFSIEHRRRPVCAVELRVPGKHNVINALAAAALASHAGASAGAIAAGLGRFRGLKRRLEVVGTRLGVTWIDDYAHHPTEVAAALATVRQMHPGRRLWCVFQPHQVSRTWALLDGLAGSLHNVIEHRVVEHRVVEHCGADKIVLAPVFRAREAARPTDELAVVALAERIRAAGGDVVALRSHAAIEELLSAQTRPGDVVVVMGAGDIGKMTHGIVERVRENRAAG